MKAEACKGGRTIDPIVKDFGQEHICHASRILLLLTPLNVIRYSLHLGLT